MDDPAITLIDHGAEGEYQARVADSRAIGRLTWVRRGDVLTAEHALVPPEIGGRGIAAKLVEALITDARAQGWKIVPECSYVAAAFKRHPEWGDLLA
ncbi:GNAT family N-acetyltransferase [Novosphingobium sp. AAP93]|uniref:GNAT family N-acetyltransferase n=1 Tax=Novosphingobium sp. AAP93 TaxID=1523427 RepID=UPI0006B9D65C|nr:GNAT family N-acetyltransferase [Novosphingobium sp. AAP93]KPF82404.1 acetyltransferase [Novosphingobium sp. AAP93]